jgi:hypothetical protein
MSIPVFHAGRLRIAAAVFAVAALLPAPSEGRVFFRWRGKAQIQGAFESIGAKSVYRGKMLINGTSGEVEVFACPDGIRETVAGMRRHLGPDSANHSGGTMAIGKASGDGRDYSFLLVQLSEVAETMVFAIARPSDASPESLAPVAISQRIPSVPSYPGSMPVFFASEQDRSSSLGVASTLDTPETVRRYYQGRLTAEGWTPATGVRDAPDRPGMTVFVRGNEILCCQADAGPGGDTRITLLHKRQGLN